VCWVVAQDVVHVGCVSANGLLYIHPLSMDLRSEIIIYSNSVCVLDMV
jgi:hypothetical protein